MKLPLNNLTPGQRGRVCTVDEKTQIGKRLIQLGLVPGTEIQCELTGPGGDPAAYRVRGTLLALRNGDARCVTVTEVCGGD